MRGAGAPLHRVIFGVRFGSSLTVLRPQKGDVGGTSHRLAQGDTIGNDVVVLKVTPAAGAALGSLDLVDTNFDAIRDASVEGDSSQRERPHSHLAMLSTFFLLRGLVYLGWAHAREETEVAQEMPAADRAHDGASGRPPEEFGLEGEAVGIRDSPGPPAPGFLKPA
jgi:hypothetical protein